MLNRRLLPYLAAALLCALFLAIGVVFIPLAGAQYDEVLFTSAIFHPGHVEAAIHVPITRTLVATMLMTYLGTLKAALYVPIFKFLGAGVATLRIPMLLAGAASVWLFFLALRRLAGAKAALLATALLATDAVYLLTSTFDWGPVALQHLFFTTAIYALVRFSSAPRPHWLFLASLAAGLALWDKALFIWLLAGFSLALIAVFPRQILATARNPRLLAAAVLGFTIGAAPFLHYNYRHRLKTFAANTEVDTDPLVRKFAMLDQSLNGSGLMGYLVRGEREGVIPPYTPLQRASLQLHDLLGNPSKSWQHLLLVLGLLAAPFLCWNTPNRRATLVFLLGGLISFLIMITTRRAGGSAHHTILLWPIPHLVLGLALGAFSLRWPGRRFALLASAAVFCVLSNLAVLNAYHAHFVACGPGLVWNNAIRPLVNYLGRQPGRIAFAADWGIGQQIEFYGNGRVGYDAGSDAVLATLPEPLSIARLERTLANPVILFVTFTEGREMFNGTRARLFEFAADKGYKRTLLATIPNSHKVPIFEVYEFRK